MHIAVTGNIGAGKSTLARLLAEHYGWEVFYEAVEDNPYLADFYADMPRWAFHLQIYFLRSRFDQARQIMTSNRRIIQDRTIYEDAHIFARNLYDSGHMTAVDYATYYALFETMMEVIKPPDLMIYLRADLPRLLTQIERRGRAFEQGISPGYLADLNRHYEQFIGHYRDGNLLVLDVNQLDYVHRPEDLQTIFREVDRALVYGR